MPPAPQHPVVGGTREFRGFLELANRRDMARASSSRSALSACACSSPATSTKASVSVARLRATRSWSMAVRCSCSRSARDVPVVIDAVASSSCASTLPGSRTQNLLARRRHRPLVVGRRHPDDDRLRHLRGPRDSTTRKRSWEPTSTACSCATGGWYTAATPTASTNLVYSTCYDAVRNCSRIIPTADGLARCGHLAGRRRAARPAATRWYQRPRSGYRPRSPARPAQPLIDNPPSLDDAERFAAHLAVEFPALFTFLWDPAVDATNWRAEQAIRPAVVIRKVCGGNRTRKAPTPSNPFLNRLKAGASAPLGRGLTEWTVSVL